VKLTSTSRLVTALVAAFTSALMLAACGGGGGDGGGGGAGTFQPRGDITMIVPFGAGGGSDRAGRALAAAIEEAAQGVNVNVENREGGSGAVGYSFMLGKQGDGETLLATETALLALPMTTDVEFDRTSFTPIMKIADDYTLLAARSDSVLNTCADVVEAAKSRRIVAGISGVTGVDNVVLSLTERDKGVHFDRVPFESGGELTAALLGGQIDVASLNPGEVIGQLRSGHVKALCAYSEQRYSDYPELAGIATAAEQGIPVSFAQFRGVIAPGGISDAARQYWIDTMNAAVQTQAYRDYVTENYLQPNTAAGDEFARYLDENNGRLQQVLQP
jgi:putative tricarboxylic transport membrane protein